MAERAVKALQHGIIVPCYECPGRIEIPTEIGFDPGLRFEIRHIHSHAAVGIGCVSAGVVTANQGHSGFILCRVDSSAATVGGDHGFQHETVRHGTVGGVVFADQTTGTAAGRIVTRGGSRYGRHSITLLNSDGFVMIPSGSTDQAACMQHGVRRRHGHGGNGIAVAHRTRIHQADQAAGGMLIVIGAGDAAIHIAICNRTVIHHTRQGSNEGIVTGIVYVDIDVFKSKVTEGRVDGIAE